MKVKLNVKRAAMKEERKKRNLGWLLRVYLSLYTHVTYTHTHSTRKLTDERAIENGELLPMIEFLFQFLLNVSSVV